MTDTSTAAELATSDLNPRLERAKKIAAAKRITKKGSVWIVPSASHAGSYVVEAKRGAMATCSCPDFELRHAPCKHTIAVELVRRRHVAADGSMTTTETLRVTYAQPDWHAYNQAQCAEKERFTLLLRDLCSNIVEPPQESGRPRIPLADVVYAGAMRTYVGLSGRRATTDIRACEAAGHMRKAPSYNALFDRLQDPKMSPLLRSLIEMSAAPLRIVERDAAADATGIGTKSYDRWFDQKWGRERKEARYLKLHVVAGVYTNVVLSAFVTDADVHDSPMFPALLDGAERAMGRGVIREVSADKAYLSKHNLAKAVSMGIEPYIPFKSGTGFGSPDDELWTRLYGNFMTRRSEFLAHYHKRSNSETVFSMVKMKFGASVRSKHRVSMESECLLKVLAHNLVVLVGATFELGLDPVFQKRGER